MPKEKPLKPTTVAKINKIKKLKKPLVAKLADAGVANWKRVKSQADFDGFCEFMGLLYGDKAEQKIAVEKSEKYFSVKLKIGNVEEVAQQFLASSQDLARAVKEEAKTDEDPGKSKFEQLLEQLNSKIKKATDLTAANNKELKDKVDEASELAGKERFEQANALLDETADLLEKMIEKNEVDDGEPLISPKQLKLFIKNSKNRRHPFACAIVEDGLAFTMGKPAKKPRALAKNIKRETGATKYSFGSVGLDGKVLVLDLEIKPLPAMMRKMKKWLKENKPLPANKVRLMENGVEVPLTAAEIAEELSDYNTDSAALLQRANEWKERKPQVAGQIDQHLNRLKELTGTQDQAALLAAYEALDKALDKLEETEEDQYERRHSELNTMLTEATETTAKEEANLKISESSVFARKADFNFIQANALLDEAQQLLKPSGPIPEAPPPPSEESAGLAARLNGLTSRIKAFAEAASAAGKAAGADAAAKKAALAPRNELLTLVRECKGMIGKNHEQAEAMLARIEEILEQSSGSSSQEAKWQTEQKVLIDRFAEAMEFNPKNRTKLEAAWAMATESAEGGDYKRALIIAAKLKPALEAVIKAGVDGESGQDVIPDNVVAFQRASVLWRDTRVKMRTEISQLEDAIIAKCLEDEELAPIADKARDLTKRLEVFDTKLIDQLEKITNSAEGSERDTLKKEATKQIQAYTAALNEPFFKDVDTNNGFVNLSIVTAAREALAAINKTLN